MRICSNELPQLENLVNTLTVTEDTDFKDTDDYYDLKETIWCFVDDYVRDNVENYKDKHFDELVREDVVNSMYICYSDTFNELELKIDID